jgi:5-oxoprolinase (ATP-hydrolysing)
VVDSITVEVVQQTAIPEEPQHQRSRLTPQAAVEQTQIFTQDQWHQTPIFLREQLEPEDCIIGPAMIVEKIGTIIVEPNWKAKLTDRNYLILTRHFREIPDKFLFDGQFVDK